MGCCSSNQVTTGGANFDSSAPPIKQLHRCEKIQLTEYTEADFTSDVDFEVVCITKPELSYIVKVENSQLNSLTLRDLETQIIEDMQGYMIESFRFLHSARIEKSFFNEKLIRFMDLLPIYIELSVDETMDYIQIEIPQSKHVINIPYDPTTTLLHIKKKIARYAALNSCDFELMHLGEILILDDMSLSECSISPQSKIIVVDGSMPESESVAIAKQSAATATTQTGSTQNAPYPASPQFCGQVSNANLLLEDIQLPNITKILTKINEEEQTLLENYDIIPSNPELEATTHLLVESSGIESDRIVEEHYESASIKEIDGQPLTADHHKPGLNILVECTKPECSMFKKQWMFHVGFGEIFLNADDHIIRLVSCRECNQQVAIYRFNFFECSFLVSGIFRKVVNKDSQHDQRLSLLSPQQKQQQQQQLKQLKKFHIGQWVHTSGKAIETFDVDIENREWKQIRIRTCAEKRSKKDITKCSLCTQNIYESKEIKTKLNCSHVYHTACFKKLQALNSPCIMCVF